MKVQDLSGRECSLILRLFWIAEVKNGTLQWRLIDRENLQLSLAYILKCETTGMVKIGITQHINRRLKEIQSMCPTKLKCVVRFATLGQGLEGFLHNHFKQYRLHGEWFLIPAGMDGLILDLSKKAGELQALSPLENYKTYQEEASYADCPF